MNFEEWLDTFLKEKGIDKEQFLEIETDDPVFGNHIMPLAVLIEAILATNKQEQEQIKNCLVKIDFMNGDVIHFFKHIAKAII